MINKIKFSSRVNYALILTILFFGFTIREVYTPQHRGDSWAMAIWCNYIIYNGYIYIMYSTYIYNIYILKVGAYFFSQNQSPPRNTPWAELTIIGAYYCDTPPLLSL